MSGNQIWSTIYLGNFADMDTDEATTSTETDAPVIGTYGAANDPLFQSRVDIAATDTAGGTHITTDNFATTDTLTYDLGSGPQVAQMDSVGWYSGSVTFNDGSSATDQFALMQDTSGNVFLLNPSCGTDLTTQGVSTLEITGVIDTDYSGITTPLNNTFVCFTPGTMIRCPGGARRVESLRVGDEVETMDRGAQPLLWIGRRTLDLRCAPGQRPVEIKSGAFGPDLPRRPLILSPQHRVMVHRGTRDEGLIAVKKLDGIPRVRRMAGKRMVTYIALLCPQHEILFANDLPVESFFPGPQALRSLKPMDQARLWVALPHLARQGYSLPARPVLRSVQMAG